MTLNEDQQDALRRIETWRTGNSGQFFVLSGSAGTGKTYTCQALLTRSDMHICFTAPTNKAVKVLRATMDGINGRYDFATTYSLLGLRMVADGSVKVLRGKGARARVAEYDLIVVDEGSMVNRILMSHLIDAVSKNRFLRVLFMGDPAQLPPVGEVESPIWKLMSDGTPCARLTKVMRHDNQILTLCTRLREIVDDDDPRLDVQPDFDAQGGVRLMLPEDFRRSIRQHAKYQKGAGFYGGTSKVIAWRNKTVDFHNQAIRSVLWGEAGEQRFVYGERVVFAAPILDEDEVPLVHTDDEGVVVSSRNGTHPDYPYKVIELGVDMGDERVIKSYVLDHQEYERFNMRLDQLKMEAQGRNPWAWKDFWKLKEAFHDVRYGYAITAHRAQGSTYTTAFVDMCDILANRNRREAYRAFYVGCSRPTTNLLLG